jgi:hypothetical protein
MGPAATTLRFERWFTLERDFGNYVWIGAVLCRQGARVPQASTFLLKVSGRKNKPITRVAAAMTMGYQRP